ncbi:hypothetical protein HER10_EVM0005306 [Colletotrichum scovillei]|uniref:uncharacterized protein n=1 Tax=Colletotrichum scovillei TaxID=1209932 RepID=UPI0015C3F795|nr:uncharacterized protein HER10_EVM0005306 [Colletotrichum scovillei]KAF4779601.1 hypothetical protein HER10_EVM0005306 [Colletotrichum scovillei]
MKFTTVVFALGVVGVQSMQLISEDPLCKYEKLSVEAWYNCNDANGGSDPYKDSDCDMPYARAGRNEGRKFKHVSNNWGGDRCALQCYLNKVDYAGPLRIPLPG